MYKIYNFFLFLVQSGKPDWNLYLWNWEKGKLITSMRSSADPNRFIADASFHPMDTSGICIVGDHTLKFFRISDNNFKQVSVSMMKREYQIYTCHSWLNDDLVAVGTTTGEVLIFEMSGSYELKAVLQVYKKPPGIFSVKNIFYILLKYLLPVIYISLFISLFPWCVFSI